MARRAVTGDIVRVDFDEKLHTYGLVLVEPYVAVYDFPTADEVTDMAEVVSKPILFVLAVYDRVLRLGTWPRVGQVPAGTPPVAVPDFFTQDLFNPQRCKIIGPQGNTRTVRPEECVGLERAAVWAAEHVAQRLRDHYAGRPNAQVESMKLRL
jgi:hypothetical protein